jgi:pimeloyl-ACP methyl ester carboxylesterase
MVNAPRTVVLVHGAWHGAWCWAPLQAALDRRGVPSYAIDLPGHGASTLPLTDLYGDARCIADTLDVVGPDVVLVGHSYGGAVITEVAATTGGIAHLVYLTAFALDAGESIMSFLGSQPQREVLLGSAILPADDGATRLDAGLAGAALYGRCPDPAKSAAIARLSPQTMSSFVQPVTGAPRASIPSTYVECTLDEAIHIDHQRAMSPRCTSVVTLETDHSPFVSMTDPTADLLAALAGG